MFRNLKNVVEFENCSRIFKTFTYLKKSMNLKFIPVYNKVYEFKNSSRLSKFHEFENVHEFLRAERQKKKKRKRKQRKQSIKRKNDRKKAGID